MNTLLTEEDLKKWTGYKQRAKIESFLRREKIPYTYGKGAKILVTKDAITGALGGRGNAKEKPLDGFF